MQIQKMPLVGSIFTLSVVVLLSCCVSSCNEKPNRGLTLQCVRLDSLDVQKWIDGGLTKPDSANAVARILLQPYAMDAAKSNFGLVAYPTKGYMDVNLKGKKILTSVDTCSRTFTGALVLANNYVSLRDLKIIDSAGHLKNFKFIRFIPVRVEANYVAYDVEITLNKEGSTALGRRTDPCPPYCSSLK